MMDRMSASMHTETTGYVPIRLSYRIVLGYDHDGIGLSNGDVPSDMDIVSLINTRHLFPVLEYIVVNPGCMFKEIREDVHSNGATMRTVVNMLLEAGLIEQIIMRRGGDGRMTLTFRFYATRKGVQLVYLYRLMMRAMDGSLEPTDDRFVGLVGSRFGNAYKEDLRTSDENHESNV